MQQSNEREACRDFIRGHCPRGERCRYVHHNNRQRPPRKPRNTECFEPMQRPVDMRIVFDMGTYSLRMPLTTRDVIVCPNVFNSFKPGEIYKRLSHEIRTCGIPEKDLFKLWHGNDKIEGTHMIVNDRGPASDWKFRCPTFNTVVDIIRRFFSMDIQATRFNWYEDTSQWKPFHHDSAYVNAAKAAVQNFTVAASFGCTRDAAFEHAKTKTVISLPQGDGMIYCFASDTNSIWRHGILQDIPVRPEGRISIICWGWVDGMGRVAFDTCV